MTTTQTPALNIDNAPAGTPVIVTCKTRACRKVTRTVKGAWSFDGTCADCGERNGFVKIALLRATLVETVKCDVNCEYARGAHCRCSCGGDNHAQGHKN